MPIKIDTGFLAHVGWGGFLTLTAALFIPILPAVIIATSIAAGKESIESLWGVWEPIQPWRDGAADLAEFAIGIVAAAVLAYVAH
jgi:hypothetical protein